MSTLFSVEERPTGKETEPFSHQFQLISDQIAASNISDSMRVPTLFSIVTGKARVVASTLSMVDATLTLFVLELK